MKSEEEGQKKSAKAIARYIRISPRKVRLVINTIRRKPAGEAFRILMTLKKKAARLAEKVLKSAVANAKVLGLEQDRLYISDIRADGGPVMKRLMTRSMGRADRILKRTTHLSLVVREGTARWAGFGSPQAKAAEEPKPKSAGWKFGAKKKKEAHARAAGV